MQKPDSSSANARFWTNGNGQLAHPNAPAGGGGTGGFSFPGTLGRDADPRESFPHPNSPASRHQDLLADGSLALANRKKRSLPSEQEGSTEDVVLNLFGIFTSVWKSVSDDEVLVAIDEVNNHPERESWFPGAPELQVFAKSKQESAWPVTTVEQVFAKIVEFKPSRVNIFSHGTSYGETMLVGNITKDGVDGTGPSFTGPEILSVGKEGFDYKGRTLGIEDVKAAFRKGREIYLYACHSGVKQEVLDGIRDALNVTVHGFVKSILYFPITNPPHPPRGPRKNNSKITGWEWAYQNTPNSRCSAYDGLQPDMHSFSRSIPNPRCEVRQWFR